MLVGTGVGRWWFTFRALRGLMAKPATEVTFPAKSHSGTKLHWCIIIALIDYVNGNSHRAFTIALLVDNASLCKRQANLLSHLHSC